MTTVLTGAIIPAMQEIGALSQGEVPSASESADVLAAFNRLRDQWAAERLMIYTATRTTWNITASDPTYTVGTGGNVNIAWPDYIDAVNFQDTSISPTLEYTMRSLTDDGWARLAVKDLTSPYPQSWYYDRAYPLGNLTLYPVPTSATLQGVIYVPTAIGAYAAESDTLALPPGYARAIVKALACDIAPMFERADAVQLLSQQAEEALQAVKARNLPLTDLRVDPGALVQGGAGRWLFDIRQGY